MPPFLFVLSLGITVLIIIFNHFRDLAFDVAAPRRKHRLFVASIDFGTTYSGYAFSSEDEWKGGPLKIQTNKWNSSNLMSAKTPTTLLLSPQREFLAFGYDAETKYSESKEDFDSNYYFHCFKLILQGNDVRVRFFAFYALFFMLIHSN